MTKNIKVKDSAKKTMNKKKSAIQSDSESDSEYETYSEFESDSESVRKGALGAEEYEQKYKNLKHNYYHKTFFTKMQERYCPLSRQ